MYTILKEKILYIYMGFVMTDEELDDLIGWNLSFNISVEDTLEDLFKNKMIDKYKKEWVISQWKIAKKLEKVSEEV